MLLSATPLDPPTSLLRDEEADYVVSPKAGTTERSQPHQAARPAHPPTPGDLSTRRAVPLAAAMWDAKPLSLELDAYVAGPEGPNNRKERTTDEKILTSDERREIARAFAKLAQREARVLAAWSKPLWPPRRPRIHFGRRRHASPARSRSRATTT